ncbi:MAG: hypothetical protein JO010_01190, partial [Alphaproteobacteria bacterium]|nr:hypothetical protein [Alphaproteobacteria bacterium]
VENALARELVQRGAARYFAARRARIPEFVRRNFSLRGTLAIHRRALGWDLLRAPANLVLAPPHVALKLAAPALKRFGGRLGSSLARRGLLIETDVAREVAWRVQTELLELPYRQEGRIFRRDALLETILADHELIERLRAPLAAIGRQAKDAEFRARLEQAMLSYAGTRAAAAEISAGLLTLGVGVLTVKQLTPGALTLGPVLAGLLAQQAAVASFPLGAALGGLWYGWFPASASPALIGGITAGLMGLAAVAASVAGILADPLQRALGLHRRRLERLVDALERHFDGVGTQGFFARDQYVARLLDLVDLIAGAYRMARP